MIYLIIAYVVVFAVLVGYVASLVRRQGNLRREVDAIRRQESDRMTR